MHCMPLIRCIDCGHALSDLAPACLHCGRPNGALGDGAESAGVSHATTVGTPRTLSSGSCVVEVSCLCGWAEDIEGWNYDGARANAIKVARQHHVAPLRKPEAGERVVFWLSALLGVFGIIPAATYANAALREDRNATHYWAAFGFGFAVSVLVWIGLFLIAVH